MIYPLTIAVTSAALSTAYFFPLICRLGSVWKLRKQVASRRVLALTYDDGPSKTVTPKLLDVLQAHRAKATFFMLGRNARRHPEIVDRVVRAGHDVGCHSDQHLNAWKALPWKAVSDIAAGYESLSPWVGAEGMFRPPYGKMTLPTFYAVRHRGASIKWWTIDSGDTHACLPQAESLVKTLVKQGGGVVLMHDCKRSHERDAFVIDTTNVLLDAAKRESFELVRLGELCE
jgi:peptidoglycan/xylan/chitin deacetylase (PgdA/CDA1 family)